MTYNELSLLIYGGNQSVDIFYTDVHPDNHPQSMEYEVAHNLDLDLWIRITPASGSFLDLIDKMEAAHLMHGDCYTLVVKMPKISATIRPDYKIYYDRNGKETFRFEKLPNGGFKRYDNGELVYHSEGDKMLFSKFHGISYEKGDTGKSS